MWLINTTTLELTHFLDPSAENVPYAILSHTWGSEEVTFQDFADLPTARLKAGFAKISKTCELAKAGGYEYAWVDTCCIDKTSSAELSEAINSMFQWYRTSDVCYVFLEDLDGDPFLDLRRNEDQLCDEDPEKRVGETAWELRRNLKRCRWFSRGWTLQELISPDLVLFFDSQGRLVFSKDETRSALAWITNIDTAILTNPSGLLGKSVHERMLWASHRETTRTEDIAYCLFGIFDINMPLIYGEGYKAFQRLQEEIVRKENDISILAWSPHCLPPPRYRPLQYRDAKASPKLRGAFAWAPSEFVSLKKFTQLGLYSLPSNTDPVLPGQIYIDSQGNVIVRDVTIKVAVKKETRVIEREPYRHRDSHPGEFDDLNDVKHDDGNCQHVYYPDAIRHSVDGSSDESDEAASDTSSEGPEYKHGEAISQDILGQYLHVPVGRKCILRAVDRMAEGYAFDAHRNARRAALFVEVQPYNYRTAPLKILGQHTAMKVSLKETRNVYLSVRGLDPNTRRSSWPESRWDAITKRWVYTIDELLYVAESPRISTSYDFKVLGCNVISKNFHDPDGLWEFDCLVACFVVAFSNDDLFSRTRPQPGLPPLGATCLTKGSHYSETSRRFFDTYEEASLEIAVRELENNHLMFPLSFPGRLQVPEGPESNFFVDPKSNRVFGLNLRPESSEGLYRPAMEGPSGSFEWTVTIQESIDTTGTFIDLGTDIGRA